MTPETISQALAIAVDLFEAGIHDRAEALLRRVLAADGSNTLALYALGRLLRDLGRPEEALEPLTACLSLLPGSAPVALACAGALAELGRFAAAVELLDKSGPAAADIDAIKPLLAKAGDQANQEGRDADAIGFYRRLAGLSPDSAAVWGTLGAVLLRSGDWQEAETALRRAVDLDPEDEGHARRLADALKFQGRLEEVRELCRRHWVPRRASLWWPSGGQPGGVAESPGPANPGPSARTSITKLVHDVEQLTYLDTLGRLPDGAAALLPALRDLTAEAIRSGRRPGEVFTLTPEQLAPVRPIYNRMVHLADPWLVDPWLADPGVEGGAVLNPDLDWSRIGRDFRDSVAGYAVIDGLLSPRALAGLTRYCLESTFWFDLEHPGGYLGAYLQEGFDHDILFAIARGLQAALPDIVGPHALRQVWAFKYDQRLSGIPPHADDAAVNVNLWIAPDDACPDPDAGGLLVYPVKVPAEWSFDDYNSINPRFDTFIREHGGAPHRIGHRRNRALLFSSDAVHATESVDFRPGYLNRRINITMLFGYR
jgi:Flp pilus assembly protein TadD